MKKVLYVLLVAFLLVGCFGKKEDQEGNKENQGATESRPTNEEFTISLNGKSAKFEYEYFDYTNGNFKGYAFNVILNDEKILENVNYDLKGKKPVVIEGVDGRDYFAFEYAKAAKTSPYSVYYIFNEDGEELDTITIYSNAVDYYNHDENTYYTLDENGKLLESSEGKLAVVVDDEIIFLSRYSSANDTTEGNVLYRHQLVINNNKVSYKALNKYTGTFEGK